MRRDAARDVGAFFLARPGGEAVVIGGDLNCEPFDAVFVEPKNALRGVRDREKVLRGGRGLLYLYNPLWRHLGEPDAWEHARGPNYSRPRPLGTLRRGGAWAVLDQVLLSREALSGPFRFAEAKTVICTPAAKASDHCAVGVEFDV
jgi:hypothetical protein